MVLLEVVIHFTEGYTCMHACSILDIPTATSEGSSKTQQTVSMVTHGPGI